MRQKNVLIVTAVAGFLCQFEKNTVGILRRAGARIHYASDFDFPAYEFDEEYFAENEIKVHPLSIRKSPVRIRDNFRALAELVRIIRREEIHVDGGAWVLRITGRDLEIKAMRSKQLRIFGWVTGLTLL